MWVVESVRHGFFIIPLSLTNFVILDKFLILECLSFFICYMEIILASLDCYKDYM